MRRSLGFALSIWIAIGAACGDDGAQESTATSASGNTAVPLVADFDYDVELVSVGEDFCTPGVASFVDRSTGDPTQWLWEFPDGSTATEQNPQLDFIDSGEEVTLTVTRGSDTDAVTEQVEYPVC